MNRNFEVELTTLCMIRNQKNEILVKKQLNGIHHLERKLISYMHVGPKMLNNTLILRLCFLKWKKH